MQPLRAPSTIAIHTDSQSSNRVLHRNEKVEFFTGMEMSRNALCVELVTAIQERTQIFFGSHLIKMEKAVFVHVARVNPIPSTGMIRLAVLRFSFTNHDDMNIHCPIPLDVEGTSDESIISKKIFERLLHLDNVCIFTNSNETMIVNEKYLTSISVLLGGDALFAPKKQAPL